MRDQKVFIIGGGPSVNQVELPKLKDEIVIGCNDAFMFGQDIVDYVVFGDVEWYKKHNVELNAAFPSERVITNHETLKDESEVTCYERKEIGWHELPSLGWNNNTGALAINFALTQGASHIYLIGFDMQLSESGESNWHPNYLDDPTEEHYSRYRQMIADCMKDWKEKWPATKITNLNVNSALECFPRIDHRKVIK